MKNLSIVFILLSLCIVFFSACKKEESDPVPSVREQIIGKWNYYSQKTEQYNADGQLEYENFGINTNNSSVEYREDGTFNSIFPGTPQEVDNDGMWEVIENGSILRMVFVIGNREMLNTINELSEEKLVIFNEVELSEGGVVKYEITLVR